MGPSSKVFLSIFKVSQNSGRSNGAFLLRRPWTVSLSSRNQTRERQGRAAGTSHHKKSWAEKFLLYQRGQIVPTLLLITPRIFRPSYNPVLSFESPEPNQRASERQGRAGTSHHKKSWAGKFLLVTISSAKCTWPFCTDRTSQKMCTKSWSWRLLLGSGKLHLSL